MEKVKLTPYSPAVISDVSHSPNDPLQESSRSYQLRKTSEETLEKSTNCRTDNRGSNEDESIQHLIPVEHGSRVSRSGHISPASIIFPPHTTAEQGTPTHRRFEPSTTRKRSLCVHVRVRSVRHYPSSSI